MNGLLLTLRADPPYPQNRLQKVTPVSPYWEIQVVDENDPKEWLHMNTECHIVTGETSKCTVVS